MISAVDVQIRLAGPADADGVAGVHAASWRSAYRGIFSDAYLDADILPERRAHWRECLDTKPSADCGVLVAIEDGVCVGFVCIRLDADPLWGPLVDNFHVRPERKGMGIGQALLAEGARWVCARGTYDRWHLWVIEANTPAQQVYEHLGWSRRDRSMHLAPDGTSYPVWRYMQRL